MYYALSQGIIEITSPELNFEPLDATELLTFVAQCISYADTSIMSGGNVEMRCPTVCFNESLLLSSVLWSRMLELNDST
jgi:hypothetical protein